MSRWKDAVVWVALTAVMAGGFAAILTSQDEVPKDNLRVLCKGIVANTLNPARDDPLVVELCGKVGVVRLKPTKVEP